MRNVLNSRERVFEQREEANQCGDNDSRSHTKTKPYYEKWPER